MTSNLEICSRNWKPAKGIPSWKLTYPFPNHFWRWFSFSKGRDWKPAKGISICQSQIEELYDLDLPPPRNSHQTLYLPLLPGSQGFRSKVWWRVSAALFSPNLFFRCFFYQLPSLKLTFSHLKHWGWLENKFPVWEGNYYARCELLIFFGE